jgi:hypothetical protein
MLKKDTCPAPDISRDHQCTHQRCLPTVRWKKPGNEDTIIGLTTAPMTAAKDDESPQKFCSSVFVFIYSIVDHHVFSSFLIVFRKRPISFSS